MKKKFLLFGGALILTGAFFTTGCKDAVENAVTLQEECYNCVHDLYDDAEICGQVGTDIDTQLNTMQVLSYTCTKK